MTMIKPADKGETLLIMNRHKYVLINQTILKYREWKNYLIWLVMLSRRAILIKGPLLFEGLKSINTSLLYASKSPWIGGWPLPPLISWEGGLSMRKLVNTLIDYILIPQPFVVALPSYVMDTLHLFKILNDLSIPEDVILVTVDVEALYSSISHKKSLEVVEKTQL